MDYIFNYIELIIGIIGVIVGLIGGKCLYIYYKDLSSNQNIRDVSNSTVNQSFTQHYGLDGNTVINLSKSTVKEQLNRFFDLEEAEKLLNSDQHYKVPIIWEGSESEYEDIGQGNYISDMLYMVVPDNNTENDKVQQGGGQFS